MNLLFSRMNYKTCSSACPGCVTYSPMHHHAPVWRCNCSSFLLNTGWCVCIWLWKLFSFYIALIIKKEIKGKYHIWTHAFFLFYMFIIQFLSNKITNEKKIFDNRRFYFNTWYSMVTVFAKAPNLIFARYWKYMGSYLKWSRAGSPKSFIKSKMPRSSRDGTTLEGTPDESHFIIFVWVWFNRNKPMPVL